MGSERWASIGLSYRRFGAFWSVQWTGKWRETEGWRTLPAQTRAPHHPRAQGSALRPRPQSRTQGYALRQHNCPTLVPPWIFRDTGKAQPVRTSAQWDRPGLQSMRQFCWHVDVLLGWMNSDYSRGRALRHLFSCCRKPALAKWRTLQRTWHRAPRIKVLRWSGMVRTVAPDWRYSFSLNYAVFFPPKIKILIYRHV